MYVIRHRHFYGHDYELSVRRALRPLSGEVCWDVGANTGYYTLLLASSFRRVTAFEPNPAAAKILAGKIAKKRIQNVVVVPIALSNHIGRSRLYLHSRVREKSIGSRDSLYPDSTAPGRGLDSNISPISLPFVEVETSTIDQTLEDGRLDLVKIDVEGAEFMVLYGARKALAERRIERLIVELHDRNRRDELDAFLEGLGYETEWLDYDTKAEISHVLASPSRK